MAVTAYLLSILLWLFGWGLLIHRHTNVPVHHIMYCGFAAVYGSFTPLQLGTEYLRAQHNKFHLGIRYSETLSASMLARGTKFLLLALASVGWYFFLPVNLSSFFIQAYLLGTAMVVLLAVLFLLPLHPSLGQPIANLLHRVLPFPSLSRTLQNYFTGYAVYFASVGLPSFLVLILLTLLQLYFELVAIDFSLRAVGVLLPFPALFSLLILVSILERVPLLPRGLGLVELAGYYFLSLPALTLANPLSPAVIASALILYDLARVLFPVLLSLGTAFFLSRAGKKPTGSVPHPVS